MWPTFESLLEHRILSQKKFDCDAVFIVHEDWLIYNTAFVKFTPKSLRKRILEALPFSRVKILSTNKCLSDYCEEWSGYRPEVVKEIEFPIAELPVGKNIDRDKLRIIIPGVYRADKNFESIGLLAEKILAVQKNIEFTIHESVIARVALPSSLTDSCKVYSDIRGASQWLDFLSGFDVVLLTYGVAYRHRISGIMHEARLINIPVICNENIADAALLANRELLYTDKGDGIEAAVAAVLAADNSEVLFSEEYPDSLSYLLSQESGWVYSIDKPVAVQIKPAWTRCGTSVVLDAQMDYLIDHGYFVVEIYLKTEPWLSTPVQVEFMWQVMRGGREFSGGMAVRVLLKDIKLFRLLDYASQLLRHKIPAFF
jgi:hypothetical protein